MKLLLKFIAVLLVILIGVALLAPYFISSKGFRQQLIQKIEQATGHSVTVEGDLRFKFFPVAGIYAEDITVGGFSGEAGAALMQLKSITIDVAVMPLLRDQIEIKSLALESPQINLETSADGRNNWILRGISADALSPSAEKQGGGSKKKWALNDIKINNGTVHYRNAQTAEDWIISKLKLSTSLTDVASPFTVNGGAEWNGKKTKLNADVASLQAILDHQPVALKVDINNDVLAIETNGTFDKDVYKGTFASKTTSLKDLTKWVNPQAQFSDESSPLAFQIAGNAECSASYCRFANSSLSLDSIAAKGTVGVSWGESIPQIDLNLATDKLDLNVFLPPQELHAHYFSPVAEAFAKEKETGWSDTAIDLSGLRAVNANVKISAKEILVHSLTIGKTTLDAKLHHGRLYATVADAEFYEGTAGISVDLDVTSETLALHETWTLRGVQAAPFFKDAFGSDRVSGSISAQMDGNSAGKSQMELISNLSGTGNLAIADGAIKGFNIANMARNIQSAFKNVDAGEQKTDFAELAGTFNIGKGIVSNNDLRMKAPLLRVAGAGTINLPLKAVSYRLVPQIVETAQGQGGKEKQGIAVPIIVSGSLENPTFQPDVAGIAQDVLKNPDAYKEKAKEIKEGLKSLKGLFKKQAP